MFVDDVNVIARAPPADWDRAEREARQAAVFVAAFVGIPALVAAGAALALVALTSLVLLAPLVAAVLTWVAWRCARPVAVPDAGAVEPPRPPSVRAVGAR